MEKQVWETNKQKQKPDFLKIQDEQELEDYF